ncbi:restriction endonuclease subunit S [Flavobacterium sp. UMI-01]|uniref:restriction endonuclease subunit S n=1 Tax=Flavobacterium sp. UMI-01 TaxID=1441053 RepID=UPI001C7D0725|nr:restriction endonuclease subunit S [Flavobacterium sp. UMI-01]GIZ09024.1 hypothetical protein FUMI01_17510 [Flavobacterium sp. UMI-01]
MKSSYKAIGNYIQLVDERNKGLQVKTLLGLSISKQFIKSVANTIGTDMQNYKIIRKNQFACSTMQVRRDKKMPVALYTGDEPAIISQAYPIFEILDSSELLPEYLMMWFSRSEFDREACFHAVGGVRGSLEWEDFCGMKLPIPSPEKQLEIVREYNVIQNRIALNNQLIAKLEETAQAVYKQWFVEFEFPDENGKPYKSNGGEMVWCEELEKEIPEGWGLKRLDDFIKITNGYAFTSDEFSNEKELPIIKISNINDSKVILENIQYSKLYNNLLKYKVQFGDILITLTGSHKTQINSAVGKVAMYNYKFDALLNQRVSKISSKAQNIIYQLIQSEFFREYLMNGATGSANQANISPDLIKEYIVVYPGIKSLMEFDNTFDVIRKNIMNAINENQKMEELKELLLAKMTKVEVKTVEI